MSRIHLFEFEDFPSFPAVWRDLETDFLRFFINSGGVYQVAAELIAKGIQASGVRDVVDLCSGGAGPWPTLKAQLEAACGHSVGVTLTDKFPNLAAFEHAREQSGGQIDFVPHPVDATAVPREMRGMRTLFTSLHHFQPAVAKGILRDAFDSRCAIGVFEMTSRTPLMIAAMMATPLLMLLSTPFTRPFRFSRLLYTLLLPVVPLVTTWNGVVSCLRTYSTQELRDLVEEMRDPHYGWEIGRVRWRWWLPPVTFLVGRPANQPTQR